MKNITAPAHITLRITYHMTKKKTVQKALAPFLPVGWCAALSQGGAASVFFCNGMASLPDTAVSKDTIFRIASISKVFGAAAAMRLVSRGALSLDEDIADVLHCLLGRKITLRQLLTHTAALDDTAAYDQAIDMETLPPLDVVLQKSFFQYAPGSRFHYSNLGAGVTGMLVEAASGMLFDDFIRKEFFSPYGIDASFHPQRIAHKERMANCYRVPGNTLAYDAHAIALTPLDTAPNPMRHYNIPAGKLMISAPDLLSAMRRIQSEQPEMFVHQDHVGSVTCDSGRGLGLAYVPKGVLYPDSEYWGHQGVAYGALCEAWMHPEDGTIAVLLTNGVSLTPVGPLYMAGQAGIAALLRSQ